MDPQDFSLFDDKCDRRHNIVAFLDDTKEKAIPFRPMIAFLRRSRIFTAITESPTIYRDHVGQFWRNVVIHTENDVTQLRSRVHDRPVIITEQTVREVLRFDDNPDMPIQLPSQFVVGGMHRIGYTGKHGDQYRKMYLTKVWKWLMHIMILCISNRRAGYDGASKRTMSAMLALVYNKPFNFSGYIFRFMVDNAQLGLNAWYMYPRFLQLMLNRELPGLPARETHIYKQTPMAVTIFTIMGTEGKKVEHRDDTPLFGHIVDPNYQPPPNDGFLDQGAPQPELQEEDLADIPVQATDDPFEGDFLYGQYSGTTTGPAVYVQRF